MPRVSIVIPVCNGEGNLFECLASVSAQTYSNWEAVVVNNCSQDATGEIAESFASQDIRFRVVHCEQFLSQAENYNRAVKLGSVAAEYVKIVEADNRLWPECLERLVTMADGDPKIGSWQGGCVVPLICYDLRFPELFRTALQLGAELYVAIANWPSIRDEHWVTLLRARAIENQAFVAGVNRCGQDPNYDYAGRSMIVAPDGRILAEAGKAEEIICSDIDWETVRECRTRFPVLGDRYGVGTEETEKQRHKYA